MTYLQRHSGLGDTDTQWEKAAQTGGWSQAIYETQHFLTWLANIKAQQGNTWNSTQAQYWQSLVDGQNQRLDYQRRGLETTLNQYTAADQQSYIAAGNRLIKADIAPGVDTHSLSWNIQDVINGWQALLGAYTDPSIKTAADASFAASEAERQQILKDEAVAAAAGKDYWIGGVTPPSQFVSQSQGGTMPAGNAPSPYQTSIGQGPGGSYAPPSSLASGSTSTASPQTANGAGISSLSEIPVWAWVLGGVGAVILFSGKK